MRNRFLAIALMVLCVLPLQAQYKTAQPGFDYQFPRDHFNHPDYRTEWWYYTGNLKAADGHRFGFELTFFRLAISRDQADPGPWGVQDLYVAHLALSDIDGKHYYRTQRVNRAGPGLAGASLEQSRVWNGNWQATIHSDTQQVQAVTDQFSLQLHLVTHKPPVIHGKEGVSQKAAGLGHASHYISFTRLLTSGTIELNGKSYKVTGTSWMDHEYFTHELEPNQAGWDWVSLQLDDNTELMLYRFRHKDGTVDPFSSGTYIDAEGKSRFLSVSDFTMTPHGETFVSPATKATYPIQWHVTVPSLNLDLELRTPLPDQELVSQGNASLTYWEGAITLTGTRGGARSSGVGYLEMTGYSKPVYLGGP
jgi:predicted secreted hydrolase